MARRERLSALVRELVDFVFFHRRDQAREDHYYDCGSEFGIVRIHHVPNNQEYDEWRAEFVTIQGCPINLDSLPGEAT